MAGKLGSRFDKLTFASDTSNIGDGVIGAAFPLIMLILTWAITSNESIEAARASAPA